MRRTLRSFSILAAFAICPAILQAQGRGGGMGHTSAAAPHFAAAPRSAAHFSAPSFTGSASFGASHIPSGSHWVRTPSGGFALRVPRRSFSNPIRSGPPTRRLLSQDVPGLGFDFPHFAAVHPGGGRGFRGRDRDRFRHDRFVGVFFPFFGGGGFWPLFPEDVDEEPSADYQQPEIAQAEPPEGPYPGYSYPAPYGGDRPPQSPAATAQTAAPEPEPPTDQYVFVRRDGTVFFAVGYMWDNGTLRYITSEGLRRSVAGSALDLDATQQFNEQRGLTFHSPA